MTALGTGQERANQLLALARLANTEFQGVRASLRRGLHQKQRELAALEAEAQHMRFFLPLMITGLLQTPEYAAASVANFPGDHPQAIAKRLDRQATLYDPAKRFTFILTEAALRWQLCEPPVMAVQMGRLASLSELPNVTIGVIPLDSHVPDGPLNTFTVYDERIATAETFGGVIMMRDPRDIAYHLELFSFFERYAVTGDRAYELLESFAQRFREISALSRLFRYRNYSMTEFANRLGELAISVHGVGYSTGHASGQQRPVGRGRPLLTERRARRYEQGSRHPGGALAHRPGREGPCDSRRGWLPHRRGDQRAHALALRRPWPVSARELPADRVPDLTR